MRKRKSIQKLTAFALATMMALGIMPLPMRAVTGTLPIDTRGEVTAFETLAPELATRKVPLGTSEEALDLPDTLTATIALANFEEDPGLDKIYPAEAGTEAEVASPSDAPEEGDPFEAEPTEQASGSTAEITLPLPVAWVCAPEYEGEAAGVYVFTPRLPEGLTPGSDVEVPRIIVTVDGPLSGTVVSFAKLDETIRWQNTSAPVFPKTVDGSVEGRLVQIPLTWKADQDYQADRPQRGLYVFTAVLAEGYEAAEEADLPRITVFIPVSPEPMMTRMMAGSGTTDNPLEITTAAQLAEIATLVNARPYGLELFLFNDPTAQVTLTLQKDIDLSDFGPSYDGGQGWMPIGTSSSPFRATFDGGGHQITGLYTYRSDNFQGFFGYVGYSGLIRNLGIREANVTGNAYVGGLAGYVTWGTIQNCWVTGSINGSLAGGLVGGLVGWMDHMSSLKNCYSAGSINGTSWVGGIAGYVYGGTVENCAALNPSVRGESSVGRIAPAVNSPNLQDNIAFSRIQVIQDGEAKDLVEGGDQVDGEPKTAADLLEAGFFEILFGNDTAWTYAEGKLPGFGAAIDLPDHLVNDTDPNFLGSGTTSDPYQIATPSQLAKLAELVNEGNPNYKAAHYTLMNDLDISAYNSREGWTPIGVSGGYLDGGPVDQPFMGTFDGGGKIISGLDIKNYLQERYIAEGLFGALKEATVKNLGVVDARIYASVKENVGGLAGKMEGGLIQNCYVIGSVNGNSNVGGIVGRINGGKVENCYSSGRIALDMDFSSASVGGVAGIVEEGGVVENCYSTADLGGTRIVGGIVGLLATSSKVENCFSTGRIGTTRQLTGGIVGFFIDGIVINCAALNPSITSDTAASRVSGGTSTTSILSGNMAFSEMLVNGSRITGGTLTNRNGADQSSSAISAVGFFETLFGNDPTWTYEKGKLPGFGETSPMPSHLLPPDTGPFDGAGTSAEDPYRIYTADDLKKLADQVNEGISYSDTFFRLENDLNLSAFGKDFNSSMGWKPIGSFLQPFGGTFDGNDKTISGLYVDRSFIGHVGLFGSIRGGTVKNLLLEKVSIDGYMYVGAVTGSLYEGGLLQNCFLSGTIRGGRYSGGMVGFSNGSTVENCFSTGSLTSTDSYVGGVVGRSHSGTVRNCLSAVFVSGIDEVGGITGVASSGTVENCYSLGRVTGRYVVGGVTGYVHEASVTNCLALNPSVSGIMDVGRVAGSCLLPDSLSNNYAFSRIPGTWSSKGLNANDGEDVTLQDLLSSGFWRTQDNWHNDLWDSTLWLFEDDQLPVLKGFEAQQDELGLYLTAQDIQYAAARPNTSSFTYNGTLQVPDLNVTFDGETLTKDLDYIVLITSSDGRGTSAGTKAGLVTLTLAGRGNYSGAQDLCYTIEKKEVTITPEGGQHKTYGEDDPVLTYSSSPQLSGNDLLSGALSRSEGENAGHYPITLGDLGEDSSYQLSLDSEMVYFSIEKRQITLAADHQSVRTGGSLPELTYSVSHLAAGQSKADALSVEPALTCPTFDGNTPGSYPIVLTGGTAADNYTITARSNGSLTIADQTYLVTFNLNGGSRTGGGELTQTVAEGGAAMAPAVSRSGYTFIGWDKAFDLVNSDLTITAKWRRNNSGHRDSDESLINVLPPDTDHPNSPSQVDIKVPGTEDSPGSVTAKLTDEVLGAAFEKALDLANNLGGETKGLSLVFQVIIDNDRPSRITANLPKSVLEALIAKEVAQIIIVSENPSIRIALDLAALREITAQAKTDVDITAGIIGPSKLKEEAKKTIGHRPAFDLRVNYGNGKQVHNFDPGTVSVTLPYLLETYEKAGNVQAVYVDDTGQVHWLLNSAYDPMEKALHFATSHFSTFGIGYKQPSPIFTDISSHWAKEDIAFVADRGLFGGTSNSTFSPDAAMTRGMFVTVLGRLANADVSSFTQSSFSDVKNDAYYKGFVEWARKNRIASGIGHEAFAPDQSMTREQMAVIMVNYTDAIGFTLPKIHEEKTFADREKVNAYARDAVKNMQVAGILSGKQGNLFDPQGTTTRAEVSTVLRRLVDLANSGETMQGWTINNLDQWMYYEEGMPVTGKKEIDGSTYTFDQYGVTREVPKHLKYTPYTVQKGDSFWLIAKERGCTVAELERLNNTTRFDLIYPGNQLRVPEQ